MIVGLMRRLFIAIREKLVRYFNDFNDERLSQIVVH
jgi:hypothetical protein